jgi:hypothetical protein
MLDHALALARRGLRVFPLVPGQKRPAIKRFYAEATADEDRIRAWWAERPDYNIGIATGDGLVVLDIDTKPGRDGRPWLDLTEIDSPFKVRTPSGGLHLYFATESEIANNYDRLAKGVDVRGYHGFVVGPGSRVAGGVYEVVE